VVVTMLAYRRISLSAKVLGVLLLAEVTILMVLAVPVLFTGGDSGLSFESFEPSNVFAGSGTGAMFVIVFGAFIGFESTAIYSDETRDPRRTVPRATFLAIGFLGIFYTFMAWIAVVAFGSSNVVGVASENPTGMFFVATERYVGHSATVVMEVLLITSTFASSLAFHNTATRYFFTLGSERLLPERISSINRFGSPGFACLLQGALALATVLAFRLFDADPYLALFLLLAGPGILAVVVLQLLCSIAVTVFFIREPREGAGWFAQYVAPPASAIGLAVATYLIVTNFDLLTGRADWVNDVLLLTLPAAFLAGLTCTLVLRRRWPDRYRRLTEARVW
jgi:amino acid transporter